MKKIYNDICGIPFSLMGMTYKFRQHTEMWFVLFQKKLKSRIDKIKCCF